MLRCSREATVARQAFQRLSSTTAVSCTSNRAAVSVAALRSYTPLQHPAAALRATRAVQCIHRTAACAQVSQLRQVASATLARTEGAPVATHAPAAHDASTTTGAPDVCLLCDTPFTSWLDHCEEPGHIARTAVCAYFVMPERSESLMQHLERHISLDLKEVDALAQRKVARRRRRLLAGLLHLVEEGVLKDCLPRTPPSTAEGAAGTPHVHGDHFMTRLLLGEAYTRRELIDRSARMVPTLTDVELTGLTTYLMSTRQLARIFDELSLQDLLRARDTTENVQTEHKSGGDGAVARHIQEDEIGSTNAKGVSAAEGSSDIHGEKTPDTTEFGDQATPAQLAVKPLRLTRDEKAALLLACIGELEHFHRQDRPRSVLSKVAADALVRNVIATHARDNILSELLHEALQRMVEEGAPVWRQHQQEVAQRSGESRTESAPAATAKSASNIHPPGQEGSARVKKAPAAAAAAASDPFALRYVRQLPLSSTPTPAPSAAVETTLDLAAAEQMIASYIAFRDVDGVAAQSSTGAASGAAAAAAADGDDAKKVKVSDASDAVIPPVYMSMAQNMKLVWKPAMAELEGRAAFCRQLPMANVSPRLRQIPGQS